MDNWGKVGASRRGVARRAIFNQAYRGTTSSGTFGTSVIPSTDGVFHLLWSYVRCGQGEQGQLTDGVPLMSTWPARS